MVSAIMEKTVYEERRNRECAGIESRNEKEECDKVEIGKKRLPIGIESFQELQTENFYYADKTSLIKDLLTRWAKVNLFTRPRRFGKSLNMSMLKCFFEIGRR